jgi:hypothetical protein
MDRLRQLIQFAEEDPDDPFNLYALALEFLKSDLPKAGALFEELTGSFPDYLPTYYPYAHWLIEQKKFEKAEEIFLKGIQTARTRQDLKTLRELQSAYNDWKNEKE